MPGRLLELHVENFRSLRDVTVPLGPLTVLVGPNGAGKSNVLSVLLLRPGPRLLAGGVRLIRQVDETVGGKPEDRHAWVTRLVRSVLRLITRHSPGGNAATPDPGAGVTSTLPPR